MKLKKIVNIASIVFSAVLLESCDVKVPYVEGNLVKEKTLQRLEKGKTTRDEALEILGAASFEDPYNSKRLYYVGKEGTKTAFFSPNIEEEAVVLLEFDDSDILKGITRIK